jgi:uncharacterized membrane protein YphA (DoxX/SURF4 family)
VELTETGALLLEEARRVLDQIDLMTAGVQRHARGAAGCIRLGFAGVTYIFPLVTGIVRSSDLCIFGGKPAYGAGKFAPFDAPVPPAMPDRSPGRAFGGYAAWADPKDPRQAIAQRVARSRSCASTRGIHGHDHAAAWSAKPPVCHLKSFWGAPGCACRAGRNMLASALVLLLRCGLAGVFLYAGADRLHHWQESLDEVTSLGLPAPRLFAALTIVTQIVRGAIVITGIFAALGALALAGFTILATVLGHRFWLLLGQPARRELTTAFEHISIVSGLLLLAVSRAGL